MSEILATIGDVVITDAEVDVFIENLPPEQKRYASHPQFRLQCKEQIIAVHCYAKYGEEELHLEETEEFKNLIASARKDILAQLAMNEVLKNIQVTEEDAVKFYEENPQHFTNGETVKAKHILVKEEKDALELMEKITSGEIAFEDAAKEYSTCPSKAQGGSLGEFGRGQMVAEFDKAAFEAEIGHVVGPVKTQFGYHLILVDEKKEASVAPYEEVAGTIRTNLLQMRQNEAYTKKAEELRARYVK